MNWTRMGALVGALMMVGAFATDAFAQRFDRDERQRFRDREWVFLGEKTVGFRVDRDVVRINQREDWYRDRTFKALHLVADRNDVYFLGVELVYLNGFSERFRVDRLVRDGEDLPIDLRGERSYIREIVMTYRSRPDFRGEAVVKVFGEPYRRGPGPGPGPIPGPGPGPIPGPGADCRQLGRARLPEGLAVRQGSRLRSASVAGKAASRPFACTCAVQTSRCSISRSSMPMASPTTSRCVVC